MTLKSNQKENLLACFQGYSELEKGMYYPYIFNKVSSRMRFSINLKCKKENIERTLEILNLSEEYKLVSKEWKIEDFSSEKPKDHYLFVNEIKSEVIYINHDNSRLTTEMWYDAQNIASEKWFLEKITTIQKEFHEMKQASFKVLSKNEHGFFTEEIETQPLSLDINTMFNDNFSEIDQIISKSIDEEKAGLILLHGLPGTGKTSYIKNLVNQFDTKKFIFVQNEFVKDLLNPSFINFLISQKDSILIIEDAEKVIMSRENNPENSVVSTILQLTDGLFSDYLSLKIICTFNTDIDKIDKALLRKGRMIAYYDFQKLSIEKTDALLNNIGSKKQGKAMTLAEIFYTQEKDFTGEKKNLVGFNK
ncbi:MAG: AAA family ATPase [Flavobacteriales bacterium]|jgi:hypothetical protein|nr:AAA family ATPase [Flavobacteriales bacterium]